jgi:hypothetical protein
MALANWLHDARFGASSALGISSADLDVEDYEDRL